MSEQTVQLVVAEPKIVQLVVAEPKIIVQLLFQLEIIRKKILNINEANKDANRDYYIMVKDLVNTILEKIKNESNK